MRKIVLVAALIGALATFAAAQYASLSESVVSRGSAHITNPSDFVKQPWGPKYCRPCLWYSGDFDPNNPNANGLANEADQLVADFPHLCGVGSEGHDHDGAGRVCEQPGYGGHGY